MRPRAPGAAVAAQRGAAASGAACGPPPASLPACLADTNAFQAHLCNKNCTICVMTDEMENPPKLCIKAQLSLSMCCCFPPKPQTSVQLEKHRGIAVAK